MINRNKILSKAEGDGSMAQVGEKTSIITRRKIGMGRGTRFFKMVSCLRKLRT